MDKHRGLHATICALDLVYVGLEDGASSEWLPADPWPWADGSLIARVRIAGDSAPSQPEFGNRLVVALEDGSGPLRAQPVVDRLNGLISHAEWIHYALAPYLK
ncbi:hypothetical protein JCM18899A_14170 [Nocardioides sp. AN3]